MGFAKYTQAKQTEAKQDDTIREKIVYKKITEDTRYGLNLAILGEEHLGKSLMAALFGMFNSKYVDKLDPELYPNSIKLLKGGYMPEVSAIRILDLDNSFHKLSQKGTFSDLLKPLKPIIEYHTISIPKRQTKMKNGSIVNARSEELFKAKREVEDAIQLAIEDFNEETLFIIDSISSYYEVLNDMFSVVYEATFEADMFSKVENQNQWQIRNAWWSETMKKKRNYPGWQIDTVKVIEKPEHWYNAALKKNPKASPYSFKWAEGSGDNAFNLDQLWWIKRDADGLAYFDLVNGRYKSLLAAENSGIYYPLKKRTAIFKFIEHMAPYLMGGDVEEEDLW